MKIFGPLAELVKVVFRKDSKEVTIDVGTQAGSATSRIFRLPAYNSSLNIDDELAATSLAQTLSNKTLNSTNLIDGSRADGLEVRKVTGAGGVSTLKFYEDESSGSNKISVQSPSALTNDYSFILPGTPGNGSASALVGLSVNGNATTTWLNYGSALGGSSLVQRDASNNFSAGTITATLSGNATNITATSNSTLTTLSALSLPGSQVSGNISGNAANITDTTLTGKTLTDSSISSTATTVVGTGAFKLPTGNASTDRPTGTATQLKGMVRYNDTDDVFEGYNELGGWSAIGGGGTTDRVTQASHGFVVGDTLYLNGSTYTKAIATAANTAEVVGIVSRVIDASTFEITLVGEISGLLASNFVEAALPATGEAIFLSTTDGKMTITEPATVGHVSVPLGVASGSGTMYVAPKRGNVIGGANARTQLSLTNGTATPTQDVSGYDAGEMTGWIYLNATPSYRFYIAIQFSRNAAGTDFNVSFQTSGDTPPAGFTVGYSAGKITVTLPSLTSPSSLLFNYALNAPAIGTTFPLAVDASSVSTGTVAAARLPVADGSNAGIVSTTTQTFAGIKTFNDGIKLDDAAGQTTLNSYVENTWTPELRFGGATTGITYSASRYGHYTRIGNRCFFNCYFALTSKGSATGSVRVYGLPFTSQNLANGGLSCVSLWLAGVSGAGVIHAYVEQNSSYVNFTIISVTANAQAAAALTDTSFSNSGEVMISGHYIIA